MKKGFSLIELIVVISILAIVSAISVPAYKAMQSRHLLAQSVYTSVSALRQAQANAFHEIDDSYWGVKFFSDNVVLFRGIDYDNRDSEYDAIYSFVQPIGIDGDQEIIFQKFSGSTTNSVVTLSVNTQEHAISINEKGSISY